MHQIFMTAHPTEENLLKAANVNVMVTLQKREKSVGFILSRTGKVVKTFTSKWLREFCPSQSGLLTELHP